MNYRDLDERVTKIVSDINSSTPGLSLLIGKGEDIIYQKGFGMADIENNIPIEPETCFIIASVTKQFTCMALMMLKERGLLDYDETIDRYFPDFPEYKNRVTIRNLMTHTSGIKEYFTDQCIEGVLIPENATQEDILNIIKGFGDLEFEPGSRFSYSNSGYVMLGAIIEKVSGLPFDRFMLENIFKPIGMDKTQIGVSPDQKFGNLAKGYKTVSDNTFHRTKMDMAAIGWADGNMVSTVGDLFKWHRALFTEKLVKSQTMQEAFKPNALSDGNLSNYGFGWFIDTWEGHRQIWHTGGTIGYISRLSRFVDDDTVIIMLTNNDGINRDDIFYNIAKLVL